MTEWVALLRGVNVGGITIKAADLSAVFRSLGLENVSTVLASGNVRFRTELADHAALKASIAHALGERFDYDAWIVLATAADVRSAADGFPFDETDAARQPWVIFCIDRATRDELLEAAASVDADIDPIAGGDGVVYWWPPKGRTTDTAFAKILAKSTYKPRTTNRNLRTLRKILA